jgi:hypothetical protein
MADNKISFLLDLDIKQFTEKGGQALAEVKKIGEGSNLAGLLGAFDKMLPVLAAGTVAFEGFKKAIDLTLAGEELDRVNRQFEILSKQAGIAPAKLKSGLEEAAKGLADTGTLMKIANESLVKIGSSSERLPELMDIATKATEVYGGTATENFQILTQALSEGNVGILKRYGLTVDLQKAQRDFAETQGVTMNQLSELGKRQAIFNAAIDAGKDAFKNIQVNTESATNTLQIMKTTFSDIGEIFTVVFEKNIGPGIREFLNVVKLMTTDVKKYLTAEFGEGVDAASAKLERANTQLAEMQADLNKLQNAPSAWDKLFPGSTAERIKTLTRDIEIQKMEINGLEISIKDVEKADEEATEKRTANIQKTSNAALIDRDKQEKAQAAFTQQMQKYDQDIFNQKVNNIQNIEQIEALSLQQRELQNEQHKARLAQISSSLVLDNKQKYKLIEMENRLHQQQLQNLELETDKFRQKLLQQYVANSNKTFEGISRAFIANSAKMKLEQQDFGKRGNEMWNSLSSNATAAFTNMGAQMAQGKNIGEATADALKGVFLGMLGDRAIAEGSILLLSSIWPPNPLGIAAGSGLLALGGALKSLAGSGGAPSTGVGASPQAVASGSAPRLEPVSSAAVSSQETKAEAIGEPIPQMEREQRAQKTVQVNIAGNYLETDQTKRMLMDLMRQETDATGFAYNQIGA